MFACPTNDALAAAAAAAKGEIDKGILVDYLLNLRRPFSIRKENVHFIDKVLDGLRVDKNGEVVYDFSNMITTAVGDQIDLTVGAGAIPQYLKFMAKENDIPCMSEDIKILEDKYPFYPKESAEFLGVGVMSYVTKYLEEYKPDEQIWSDTREIYTLLLYKYMYKSLEWLNANGRRMNNLPGYSLEDGDTNRVDLNMMRNLVDIASVKTMIFDTTALIRLLPEKIYLFRAALLSSL